jgi:hypothetical protein
VPVVEKAQPARFMYNNSEIIKRTHAAGINVRVLLNSPSVHEVLTTHLFDRMCAIWFYTLLLMRPRPVG